MSIEVVNALEFRDVWKFRDILVIPRISMFLKIKELWQYQAILELYEIWNLFEFLEVSSEAKQA